MAGLGFKDFAVGEVLTAADVDGYLMQQSVMRFADAGARGSALGTATGTGVPLAEGMVSYLDDGNVVQVYDGTNWVAVGSPTRVVFTSNGTFTKASYPGASRLVVTVVGGGGGGGGSRTTSATDTSFGGGGGAGSYSRSVITDIAGLAASVTVTVGSGGAGGVGNASGSTGGASSFGALVTTNGGVGGGIIGNVTPPRTLLGGAGGAAGTGDLAVAGQNGVTGHSHGTVNGTSVSGAGAPGFFGGGALPTTTSTNGNAGTGPGSGGSGAMTLGAASADRNGGAGANGIVIVDVY